MAIGLVSAGLMTLRQVIGVIFGANIGTTMTAFIVGIKIENYALPIIAVGAFLLFFISKKKAQYIGQIIFGFGTLFLGLSTMSGGLKPLQHLPAFKDFIVELSAYPVLGVLVGTVFTMVVQSSSATIGILQTIADDGMISLRAALPVLFGDNIGTTITAILAAIGTTVAAKRTALVHVIFNVVGTIVFTLALPVVYWAVLWIGEGVNIRLQIAYAHALFNVTNTLIFIPFIPALAWLATRLIPGKMAELEFKAKYLDERFLTTPSIALGQAQNEVVRMGGFARGTLQDATAYFFKKNDSAATLALQKESLVNELEHRITDYMVKIHQHGLPAEESVKASELMHIVNDIERIGDHAENIVELSELRIVDKINFSEAAEQQLQQMLEVADQTLERALYALEHDDAAAAEEVLQGETMLDQLEEEYRISHFDRMQQEDCNARAGAIFLDILSNLERVGDHSRNIAEYILQRAA